MGRLNLHETNIMGIRLFIWVTSNCNLSCKWCSQNYTMTQNKGYQMSQQEITDIVNECIRCGIIFDTIEITGGEPTLWDNIEFGVNWFKTICGTLTLATNGNNPELVKSLGLKTWIVSESQATLDQMSHYRNISGLTINSHSHKKIPAEPIPNSLPAECVLRNSPQGIPQNALMYLRGKIYYCCNAFALSDRAEITNEIFCNFEDDYITKFSGKKFDKEICSYCLCNSKVWNSI